MTTLPMITQTTSDTSADAFVMRLRMLDDLLSAERTFRTQAETKSRALIGVLTEMAYRLAGQKLEEMRQKDPLTPQNWSPEDWRAFFLSVQVGMSEGWGMLPQPGSSGQAEIAKLQAKAAALERELQRLREQHSVALPRESVALPREAVEVSAAGRTATAPQKADDHLLSLPDPLPYGSLLPDLVALQSLPEVPALYADRFKVDGISNREAALNLRRRALVLRCLAVGLSVSIEISFLIGGLSGGDPRSGSIRRVWDALEKQRLIVKKTLAMTYRDNSPTRLVVARLSEDGKHLVRNWGWPVEETEWERLNRLHEGEKQEAHTLSILLFAASARLRGWKVSLLPEVPGPAAPDIHVEREGVGWYVEVETGTREQAQNAKWRLNAELNGGRVALCARNSDDRQQLIDDCRHVAQHGVACDVEMLVAERLHEPAKSSLWAIEW